MRSLPLSKLYQARLFVDVYISGIDGCKYPFDCIVDTGCVNTLVDEKILEVADYIDLGFTQPIKIAGMSTVSRAVVLKQVDFGGFVIDRLLVFVASTFMFTNPNAKALECVKKLLEMRVKDIT